MYKRLARILILLLILLLLAYKGNQSSAEQSSAEQSLEGSIMLWHGWNEAETKVLDELLEQFSTIHPNITVITQAVSATDSEPMQFINQAALGLGPDMLIGSSRWEQRLVQDRLLHNLDRYDIDLSVYLSTIAEQGRYQDGLYALPLSLQTHVLYYNKKQLNSTSNDNMPVESLQSLLDEAAAGRAVALNTNFYDAFWGIPAFGGTLFDDQGRVLLNQGGFANWLAWLKKAQSLRHITLSQDAHTLRTLFKTEQVVYYIGNSTELSDLQEALGKDVVGVAPLPAGPNNPAGPFMEAEAMMFNASSSPEQIQLALELAKFLSNVEQQTKLAQQTGRVPANATVRIDPRAFPEVAALVTQSKTAFPVPNIPQFFDLLSDGDQVYVQVLEGIVDISEAVGTFTAQINQKYDVEEELPIAQLRCPAGKLKIWQTWSEAEAEALNRVRLQFMSRCPEVQIDITNFMPDDILMQYPEALLLDLGTAPDLLLISNYVGGLLAFDGLIRDMSSEFSADFLQRYDPTAQETLNYQGNIFGLPVSMETMALYYNKKLVSNPPLDLDDLLNQASSEHPVALPVGFNNSYWGMAAFGGRIFDSQGELSLNEGGLADWLAWLQEAQSHPGITLSNDYEEMVALFGMGKASYLVGHKIDLARLQAALGEEVVGVTALPAGAVRASGPIIGVLGFAWNPKLSPEQVQLALEFAKYATNVESQTLLMEEALIVPANVNVDTTDYPAIAGFLEQAKTAVVPPGRPETFTVLRWGDLVYEQALSNDINPTEAAAYFHNFVKETHGDLVDAEEGVPQCVETGQLSLWHSWSGNQAAALSRLIGNFTDNCPDIQLEVRVVPASELLDELARAAKEETSPDLFLAANDLIVPLAKQKLIKPMSPLVNQSDLIGFLPSAIKAVEHNDLLYGWPQTLNTYALYYNAMLVAEVPRTLEELLTTATPLTPLALDSSFEGAFWGLSAFSEPWAGNQLYFDEPHFEGFVTWLERLKRAQQENNGDGPSILFSPNTEHLQQLFAAEKAAYLVASTSALPYLQETLGAHKLGVITLPQGSAGDGNTLLEVEAFLFSAGVRDKQSQLALIFAQFASSAESQALLAQEADLIPSNGATLTRIPDLNPLIKLAMQSARTVPLPPRPEKLVIFEGGDKAYENVLESDYSPSEAVAEFKTFITDPPQPESTEEQENLLACEGNGELLLWVGSSSTAPQPQLIATELITPTQESEVITATIVLTETQRLTPTLSVTPTQESEVMTPTIVPTETQRLTPRLVREEHHSTISEDILAQLIADFSLECPEVQVETKLVPVNQLTAALATAFDESVAPDILLAPHDLLGTLKDNNLIKAIDPFIDETMIEQYHPESVLAFKADGLLYGLPQTMDVMALYYNNQMVEKPARTLDDLLASATQPPLALDSSFYGAAWGVSAFGGQLPTEEGSFKSNAAQAGFIAWLSWLQEATAEPAGILFSANQSDLQERFAAGDAAYLVAHSSALPQLRAQLGQDHLSLTTLPAGEAGEAKPFLRVDGFFFTATSEEQSKLALTFAKFMTSEPTQTSLAQQASLLPTNNLAITLLHDPALSRFVKQSKSSILLPDKSNQNMFESGNNLYHQVLVEGDKPTEALRQWLNNNQIENTSE